MNNVQKMILSQTHLFKQPLKLTSLCKEYIVKYMHHVVWRQLDPPKNHHHDCFYQEECKLYCGKMPARKGSPSDMKEFRRNLAEIREYLKENLPRQLHWDLSRFCGIFVEKNKLKYVDVLLYLIFQDKDSTKLELTSRHIVCRKWKSREKSCLLRTLCESKKLVKLALPGQVNDSLLFVIAVNCHLLQELDISNSYITEKGLLAICGVVVKHKSLANLREDKVTYCNQDVPEKTICDKMKMLRNRKEIYVESENYISLSTKMEPFLVKRLKVPGSESLRFVSEGKLYRFKENFGCLKLRKLDIDGTNFPRNGMSKEDVGINRDCVLTVLILLENLIELNWPNLGEVVQFYKNVVEELCTAEDLENNLKLNLLHFIDTNTCLDKLTSVVQYCPKISKIDLWGHNSTSVERKFWLSSIFSLPRLNDFAAEWMDDSILFKSKLRKFGHKLTRLCLNKMISISFSTLAAIKTCCPSLRELELYVYEITSGSSMPLEQAVMEAPAGKLEDLVSLQIGGTIPSGEILKYLVFGCPRLKTLSCIFFNYTSMTCINSVIKDMFDMNPCKELEIFCFERCFLHEATFFYLLSKLPSIKYIGNMEEWFMDMGAISRIRKFLKNNEIMSLPPKLKQPPRLSSLCQEYIVKYMHHVVWRQLDPPKNHHHDCIYQEECHIQCPKLPNRKSCPTSIKEFRQNLAEIRTFLGDNLSRQACWDLSKFCGIFIQKNKMKHVDVLLYLIFQDKYSISLELTSCHIICRKWKSRERSCLNRTLCEGKRLVKLALPGQVNDSLLFVIAQNCHLLEDLNISHSEISKKGVLALGGVVVKYSIGQMKTNKINYCTQDGKESLLMFDDLKMLKKKKKESSADDADIFSLSSKMIPFLVKRLKLPGAENLCWTSGRHLYKYKEKFGCPKLKKLDIEGTNNPLGEISWDGSGVTRSAALALLILLENLTELKWSNLGDIVQSYQKVVEELINDYEVENQLKLKLSSFVDISTSLENYHNLIEYSLNLANLPAVLKYCPSVSKVDFWGNNLSSSEKQVLLDIIFEMQHLKDFETQFMGDCLYLEPKIRNFGGNLSRVCLNKMITISFPTIAAIKKYCSSLKIFELYVHEIKSGSTLSLEQEIRETTKGGWKNLLSLQLGGDIPNGEILQFLISGCLCLKKFCCMWFNPGGVSNMNNVIKDLFSANPCDNLEVFCFERCFLLEETFFYLLRKLPSIKYIGNMEEWEMMDPFALPRIKDFIKKNNIDVDIESHIHSNVPWK